MFIGRDNEIKVLKKAKEDNYYLYNDLLYLKYVVYFD